MDPSILKPFHGIQTSLIPLSSGYYLYLCCWDKTPTDLSSFTNIWFVTPEDHRTLFVDPADSSSIPLIYHNFHEVVDASISMDWESEDHLSVICTSLPGDQEILFEITMRDTLWSRSITKLSPTKPSPILLSKFMVVVTSMLVNLLVTKAGMTLFGVTETGQPFYAGVSEKLKLIEQVSAAVNGMDLGNVTSPTWSAEFGDFIPCAQPVIRWGTLFIPYENHMVHGGSMSNNSVKFAV